MLYNTKVDCCWCIIPKCIYKYIAIYCTHRLIQVNIWVVSSCCCWSNGYCHSHVLPILVLVFLWCYYLLIRLLLQSCSSALLSDDESHNAAYSLSKPNLRLLYSVESNLHRQLEVTHRTRVMARIARIRHYAIRHLIVVTMNKIAILTMRRRGMRRMRRL